MALNSGSGDKSRDNHTASTTTTGQLSFAFPGGSVADIVPIDTHTDSDDTTKISYDPGALSTTYDAYIIDANVFNEHSSGVDLQMRVNGDGSSTGNYDQRNSDGTTTDDANQWKLMAVSNNRSGVVRLLLQNGGENPAGDAGAASGGIWGSQYQSSTAQGVRYDQTGTINQFEIFTSNPAAVDINVYGVNYA